MTRHTHHNAKLPALIAAAFILAVIINVLLNWLCLNTAGKQLAQQFNASQMSSPSDKLIYLERQATWPILFLGSSQVHWGVNPEAFSTLQAFNLGMKGTYFKSQDFVLTLLMAQHKKPALVILECSPILTNRHQNEFIIKKDLMPYLVTYTPQSLLEPLKTDGLSAVKLFQVLQFVNPVDWLAGKQSTAKTYYNSRGFEGRDPLSQADQQHNQSAFSHLDPSYIAHYQFDETALLSIIHQLKKAGIQAIFIQYPVTPPMKAKLEKEGVLNAFETSIKTLSAAHQIPYWNLSSVPELDRHYTAYFVDGNHLNKNGALVLSRLLEKKLLEKKRQHYAF